MHAKQSHYFRRGTAGLCLAISLRYFGIEVKVYEKRPQPGGAGAGIIIAPNALQALEPFGITDRIIQAGYGRDGIQTLTQKGKKSSRCRCRMDLTNCTPFIEEI